MQKPAFLTMGLLAIPLIFALAPVPQAHALSMKECSAKYKAAKAGGNTLAWKEFRTQQCGSGATEAAATPAASSPAPTSPTAGSPTAASPTVSSPAAAKPATSASMAAAPAGVTFPTAVSAKYAKESPGKARMHTCLDSYNEAKSANHLGGLHWIQKGGGYYSQCNARLKG